MICRKLLTWTLPLSRVADQYLRHAGLYPFFGSNTNSCVALRLCISSSTPSRLQFHLPSFFLSPVFLPPTDTTRGWPPTAPWPSSSSSHIDSCTTPSGTSSSRGARNTRRPSTSITPASRSAASSLWLIRPETFSGWPRPAAALGPAPRDSACPTELGGMDRRRRTRHDTGWHDMRLVNLAHQPAH